MAGAERRVLHGDGSLAKPRGDVGAQLIGALADHDDDALAAGALHRVDGVVDERPTADGVQHLRDRRLHARALPGGEDHGGAAMDGGHGASQRNRRLVIGAGLAETAARIDWMTPLPVRRPPLPAPCIAFDLDGTLVDTAPDLIGTLNYILAEHGHDGLPLEAARTIVGHGARAMLTRGFAAAGETLAADRMDRLFERFIDLYVGRIAMASRPFPGVIDALDDLERAGARFAVCTNKRTDLSLALLDALDLTRRFAAVVGPDLAGAAKPDPRHLAFAVEAAGGGLGRALMVGDASTDTEAAKAARVPVIAVSFGYSDVPAADLGADALIDHFGELPAAARRLLRPARAAISPILPDRNGRVAQRESTRFTREGS